MPVDRPRGLNKAGILAAVVTTPTPLHPEGVTRVVLCGDPTKSLGSVSEPECPRIIAALDLAERMQVPLEWYALSAGARISMDSGTENMDWVAAALRRIVEFTQAGGEINVVVAGINVGAQPYWNAEATMLMHTKGILVMTPDSAMVLTGKQSLDFSGGVSAEDNFGIGGYDRVMGPNGQAQYWAPNLAGAFDVLMSHYEHTYVVPGEGGPRRAATTDPSRPRRLRRTRTTAEGSDFRTVGEIFSAETNPDRKKAFDIRTVMRAVADQDHADPGALGRHGRRRHRGRAGRPPRRHPRLPARHRVAPVPRRGFPPTDGPDTYTAGTLFPRSSKKAARAINAASGNRPLVVLANLSGFDGSPDSMRNLQLEYGAEIGRAIVNFRGPDRVLRDLALPRRRLRGVLQGAEPEHDGARPRGVVRVGDRRRARRRPSSSPARWRSGPPRAPPCASLEARIADATGAERSRLLVEQAELRAPVRAEKISEVAAEFDGDPQHPPRGRGRLRRRGDPGRAAAARDHRGARALARRPGQLAVVDGAS